MARVRVTLKPDGKLRHGGKIVRGRIDAARLNATTEAEIAKQAAADDAEAMRDAAAYARRVRKRTG